MTIDAKTLSHWEPVYHYIRDDGTNLVIHAGRLRQWCIDQGDSLPLIDVPISKEQSHSYIRDNVVSRDRVKELHDRYKRGENLSHMIFAASSPIIWAKEGPYVDHVMHVDGHHRYVLYSSLGLKFVPSWLVEPSQWSPFIVTGVATLTKQELRDLPITRRNY